MNIHIYILTILSHINYFRQWEVLWS